MGLNVRGRAAAPVATGRITRLSTDRWTAGSPNRSTAPPTPTTHPPTAHRRLTYKIGDVSLTHPMRIREQRRPLASRANPLRL